MVAWLEQSVAEAAERVLSSIEQLTELECDRGLDHALYQLHVKQRRERLHRTTTLGAPTASARLAEYGAVGEKT